MSAEFAARLPANVNNTKADARGAELKSTWLRRARQTKQALAAPLLTNRGPDRLLQPNVHLLWEEPTMGGAYSGRGLEWAGPPVHQLLKVICQDNNAAF